MPTLEVSELMRRPPSMRGTRPSNGAVEVMRLMFVRVVRIGSPRRIVSTRGSGCYQPQQSHAREPAPALVIRVSHGVAARIVRRA
jgi:hypothetical protein